MWERVRVKLFSFVQESSALVLGKYRKPTSIQGIEGTEIISPSSESSFPCGIRQEVVSPEWCFTSTMSVTIVTLYSGSQMVPQLSPAVEFYYVIQGEGIYVRGEEDEVMKLSTGLCFVVDPFCLRGFTAHGRTDLVLLRASDATTLADEQYVTRRVDNPVSTTIAVLNAGLHKVEALVSNYGATPSQDETINNVADV